MRKIRSLVALAMFALVMLPGGAFANHEKGHTPGGASSVCTVLAGLYKSGVPIPIAVVKAMCSRPGPLPE